LCTAIHAVKGHPRLRQPSPIRDYDNEAGKGVARGFLEGR